MGKVIEMNDKRRTPEDYLKEPYMRMVIPDQDTGTYTAQIFEFPGCITQGDTVQDAYQRLEETALSWIEAALDSGHDIPPPASVSEFGGKIALRLPKSLHRQVALAAERDGTSLNQFIVMAVAERVGASNLYDNLTEKLEHLVFQTSVKAAVGAVAVMGGFTIQRKSDNLDAKPAPVLTNLRKVNLNARNETNDFFS